jgi:hypothetical protein
MFVVGRNKFRVFAALVILYLCYSFGDEYVNRPKLPIEKSWKSLATNAGY